MSDDLPIVGRPRGSAWRQLQSEGILWEGQILVAGGETDLAALLVVTNERLSLIRGGTIALDIKHDWLAAPPTLRRTGTVGLQVRTPGQRLPESLTFIVREGRLAAAELVDVLTPHERYEPEFPTWDSNMFLDEEPIIPAHRAPYERKHSPAPVDPLPAFPVYAALDDDDFPPIAPPPDPMPDWSGAPRLAAGAMVEPANVIPRQNENDWNLKPISGMDNKDRRDRRAWVGRIAAIFLAVAGIAAWQSGLLPDSTAIRDRFANNTPEIRTIAELPVGTPTELPATSPALTPTSKAAVEPVSTAGSTATAADAGPSSTQQKPTYAPAEQTALALGVGGETDPAEAAAPSPPAEPAATDTPVIEPPATSEAAQSAGDGSAAAQPDDAASAEPSPADELAATQPPPTQSVMPERTPAGGSTASSGQLDYEITDVRTGASLPDLTLGPLRDEQWVVVTLDVKNRGNDVATLDMSGFVLQTADGSDYALDSATGAVASYLGMASGHASGSTREIGPGERLSVVLVFVPPADATGLTLGLGDTSLPLEVGAASQTPADTLQSSGGQTANQLSTQLLTNAFEQFDILSPTSTANAKIAPNVGNPWGDIEE